jgi:hypothetical protein
MILWEMTGDLLTDGWIPPPPGLLGLRGLKISKNFKIFLVFPNPMDILNQKNLWPTLIYQFEHIGTPYWIFSSVWTRKKIQFIKLNISNLIISKIKCR